MFSSLLTYLPLIGGIIRAILAAVGGVLAAKGFFDQGEIDQLTAAIEQLIGLTAVIATIVWSGVAKWRQGVLTKGGDQ